MVSIPACHAGDRGSIPRRGDSFGFRIKMLEMLFLTMKFEFKGFDWLIVIQATKETSDLIRNITQTNKFGNWPDLFIIK